MIAKIKFIHEKGKKKRQFHLWQLKSQKLPLLYYFSDLKWRKNNQLPQKRYGAKRKNYQEIKNLRDGILLSAVRGRSSPCSPAAGGRPLLVSANVGSSVWVNSSKVFWTDTSSGTDKSPPEIRALWFRLPTALFDCQS